MTATKHAPIVLPEYNGWANYPTWNVMLWINNDEGSYRDMVEFAATHPDKYDVRAYIMRYIMRSNDAGYGCAVDMRGYGKHYGLSLYALMQRIDYDRITEAVHEDYIEEEEQDQDHEDDDLTACYLCRADLQIDDAFRIGGEWVCVDCAAEHEAEREEATGTLT